MPSPGVPRWKPSDRPSASKLNELADLLRQALQTVAGGELEYIFNSAGLFRIPQNPPHHRFRLNGDLYRTGSASADRLTWDGSAWVDDLTDKTIYGDFVTGYWFTDDKIWVMEAAGRLYAVGSGRTFIRGVLDSELAASGSATLSVSEWNGSSYVDSGNNVTVHEAIDSSVATIALGTVIWASWEESRQAWIAVHGPC